MHNRRRVSWDHVVEAIHFDCGIERTHRVSRCTRYHTFVSSRQKLNVGLALHTMSPAILFVLNVLKQHDSKGGRSSTVYDGTIEYVAATVAFSRVFHNVRDPVDDKVCTVGVRACSCAHASPLFLCRTCANDKHADCVCGCGCACTQYDMGDSYNRLVTLKAARLARARARVACGSAKAVPAEHSKQYKHLDKVEIVSAAAAVYAFFGQWESGMHVGASSKKDVTELRAQMYPDMQVRHVPRCYACAQPYVGCAITQTSSC
jgi:hypothetical protein